MFKKTFINFSMLCILTAFASSALAGQNATKTGTVTNTEIKNIDKHQPISRAVARIYSTEVPQEAGVVYLIEETDGVRLIADLKGLTPGEHGIHIHKFGDCSNKAEAAGPHYDMSNNQHGGPVDQKRHSGDLGNITANQSGEAALNQLITGENLHFLIGRSVVVHASKDDLKTQPSGNSGARVACGVIGISEVNKVNEPKINTLNQNTSTGTNTQHSLNHSQSK
jgi:superoxide dismutase, Cu-Zn family